jgi:phosphoribosylformimino-5-aminoimidazole carboxamide ribotide isomerase
LHVVDLDGAIRGKPVHLEIISSIVKTLDIPVQVGGGIRDLSSAEAWIEIGVARVVIGTAAVRDPDMVQEVCRKLGSEKIVVSVDAKDGLVALQGWQESSSVTVLDLASQMAKLGVVRLLYTDIARDGALTGPDLVTNARLTSETDLAIQASGGVSSLEDLRRLLRTGVEGVIIGRALYTGAVSLPNALEAID